MFSVDRITKTCPEFELGGAEEVNEEVNEEATEEVNEEADEEVNEVADEEVSGAVKDGIEPGSCVSHGGASDAAMSGVPSVRDSFQRFASTGGGAEISAQAGAGATSRLVVATTGALEASSWAMGTSVVTKLSSSKNAFEVCGEFVTGDTGIEKVSTTNFAVFTGVCLVLGKNGPFDPPGSGRNIGYPQLRSGYPQNSPEVWVRQTFTFTF
jgi:hypothetical protein